MNTDWMDSAACAGTDSDAFFAPEGGTARMSIRVCRRCPVQKECLQYAVDQRITFGIWGGLGVRKRRLLWRRNEVHGV